MDSADFYNHIQGNYDEFFRRRRPRVLEFGLERDDTLNRMDQGVALILRLNHHGEQALANVAEAIGKLQPATIYGYNNLHFSVVARKGKESKLEATPIASAMWDEFGAIWDKRTCEAWLRLIDFVTNQQTAIAACIPSPEIVQRIDRTILKASRDLPVFGLKLPDMCHSTLARYHGKTEGENVLKVLAIANIQYRPAALLVERVEMAHFSFDAEGKFILDPYEDLGN